MSAPLASSGGLRAHLSMRPVASDTRESGVLVRLGTAQRRVQRSGDRDGIGHGGEGDGERGVARAPTRYVPAVLDVALGSGLSTAPDGGGGSSSAGTNAGPRLPLPPPVQGTGARALSSPPLSRVVTTDVTLGVGPKWYLYHSKVVLSHS